MSQPQLCRGAIARGEGVVGVVWSTDEDAVYLIPVTCQGAGRHRSDVMCEAEPLLPRKGALRTGALKAIRSRLTVTGHVSADTIAALDRALRRELRARAFEDRFPAETVRGRTETAVRF